MNKRTKNIVMAALMAALACIATMIITIPSPLKGYLNLGDCVVILAGCLLGPAGGAAAGGIGSALADLLAGYPAYVPATLVIKAIMGALVGGIYRRSRRLLPLGALAAETVMVLGYWLFDGFLMGSLAGSAAGIPSNLMQAVFGMAAALALAAALGRSRQVREWFPGF